MSLIGALLLLEPMLLSSNVVRAIMDHRLPDNMWFVFALVEATASGPTSGTRTAQRLLYKLPTQLQLSPVAAMWITVLATALTICLLFGSIMPVPKSKWWGRMLLAVQLALFAWSSFIPAYWLALFQRPKALRWFIQRVSTNMVSLEASAAARFGISLMFPFVWSALWAIMFVLWPLLHSWRSRRRQQMCGDVNHRKLDQHTDTGDNVDSKSEENV